MNYLNWLKKSLPEKSLDSDLVKKEMFYIKRDNLAEKYFSFAERAKGLGRRLENHCNSIIGFLLGFANKPTGDLVLSSYESPPD